MLIMILDSETTGLPAFKDPSDAPHQPVVVDLAWRIYEDGGVRSEFDRLINNPDVFIPEDMTAIHGITDDMCRADGMDGREAVRAFLEAVRQVDLLCGYNVSFDIRMMRMMAARYLGEKWDNPLPTYCVMRKSQPHCRILKANPRFSEDWKAPKLIEAYEHFFGEPLEQKHRAMPDVEATERVYFHLKTLEPAYV